MPNIIQTSKTPSVIRSTILRRIVKHTVTNKVLSIDMIIQIVKSDILRRIVRKAKERTLDTSRFKFFQTPAETPDGSTTLFTLAEAYVTNTLTVYRDQLALQRTTDFTETDNDAGTFTLVSAPLTGEVVWCNYISLV